MKSFLLLPRSAYHGQSYPLQSVHDHVPSNEPLCLCLWLPFGMANQIPQRDLKSWCPNLPPGSPQRAAEVSARSHHQRGEHWPGPHPPPGIDSTNSNSRVGSSAPKVQHCSRAESKVSTSPWSLLGNEKYLVGRLLRKYRWHQWRGHSTVHPRPRQGRCRTKYRQAILKQAIPRAWARGKFNIFLLLAVTILGYATCILLFIPLLMRHLLKDSPMHRKATRIWLSVLNFIATVVLIILFANSNYQNRGPHMILGILLLVLTPGIARYIATRKS